MFLKKYQGVFQSRWKALWWAAGVCLTAYCTVPSKDQDNSDVVPGITSFAHHGKAKHADSGKDPWALDTPAAGKTD